MGKIEMPDDRHGVAYDDGSDGMDPGWYYGEVEGEGFCDELYGPFETRDDALFDYRDSK